MHIVASHNSSVFDVVIVQQGIILFGDCNSEMLKLKPFVRFVYLSKLIFRFLCGYFDT